MKITINEKVYEYEKSLTLEEIVKQMGLKDILAATVDGRLRELTYLVVKDSVIEFLSYNHPDAVRIYETTLRYVLAMAVKNLYPKAKVKFNYSISRSILAVLEGIDDSLRNEHVEAINQEVLRIVKQDLPIYRERIPLGEAMDLYRRLDMPDKVAVLEYREEEYVNLYECDGYVNYMFGYMLPRTSYINSFRLFL
ncbi:MAG: hypothetical protein WCY22_01385, partial [Acholeplasmataceae bacterium]